MGNDNQTAQAVLCLASTLREYIAECAKLNTETKRFHEVQEGYWREAAEKQKTRDESQSALMNEIAELRDAVEKMRSTELQKSAVVQVFEKPKNEWTLTEKIPKFTVQFQCEGGPPERYRTETYVSMCAAIRSRLAADPGVEFLVSTNYQCVDHTYQSFPKNVIPLEKDVL